MIGRDARNESRCWCPGCAATPVDLGASHAAVRGGRVRRNRGKGHVRIFANRVCPDGVAGVVPAPCRECCASSQHQAHEHDPARGQAELRRGSPNDPHQSDLPASATGGGQGGAPAGCFRRSESGCGGDSPGATVRGGDDERTGCYATRSVTGTSTLMAAPRPYLRKERAGPRLLPGPSGAGLGFWSFGVSCGARGSPCRSRRWGCGS